MAQPLRARLSPNTHAAAHKTVTPVSEDPTTSSGLLGHQHLELIHGLDVPGLMKTVSSSLYWVMATNIFAMTNTVLSIFIYLPLCGPINVYLLSTF